MPYVPPTTNASGSRTSVTAPIESPQTVSHDPSTLAVSPSSTSSLHPDQPITASHPPNPAREDPGDSTPKPISNAGSMSSAFHSPSAPSVDDDLSSTLGNTTLEDTALLNDRRTSHTSERSGVSLDAPPSLVSEAANSASSTSLASLSSAGEASSPPSSAGATVSPAGDGKGDAVARYKEGLFAYTKTLYVEAKLSSSRAEKVQENASRGMPQFGMKQSGMERLAAKKALAKRLNG